jgi:membrane fusion protein (multidrug efflux system)
METAGETARETAGADDGKMTASASAMIKPLLILFIAVAVILGGVFAWRTFIGRMMKQGMSAAASAPQTVSTTQAATSSWQAEIQATGSVRAVRGADLSAQASGVVDKIAFDSGSEVAAGAVLLTLKPNDDPAKLAELKAAAELAEITYKRDQEQFAAQAISQATLDGDLATLKSDRAQVAAQEALIEEKIVKAPFAGKLGIRQVDEGQYLTAGTAVVTLQALDPIFIDFYVPQQALAHIKAGQAVSASVDAYPREKFSGVMTSINSKVDAASRTVQVRASFHNADRRLVPGMYATVLIDSGEPTTAITLPQTAITKNPYGDTVFVVQQGAAAGADGKPRSTVQQRFVTLGNTRGDQVAVLSGIAVGDVVVTAGQLKLHNGAAVAINNAVEPLNDPRPTPPNQ